jgi:hypothetical protein
MNNFTHGSLSGWRLFKCHCAKCKAGFERSKEINRRSALACKARKKRTLAEQEKWAKVQPYATSKFGGWGAAEKFFTQVFSKL